MQGNHLWRLQERSIHPQIPDRVVLHGGQIIRDGNCHFAVVFAHTVGDSNPLIPRYDVPIAYGVIVQRHGVGGARVLGEVGVAASRGFAIELQRDFGSGGDSGIVGDALEDIDASVVALTPS